MDTPSYIYHEFNMGKLLVVEDLHFADYSYTQCYEENERYEIREAGVRLERFGTVEEVEEFLETDIKPVSWYLTV